MPLHTCMLCEAVCGLQVELTPNGSVKSLRGDKQDPFSQGHLCPKAAAIPDIQNDPDRVRHPQVRLGHSWQDIAWKDAWRQAGAKLAAVQKKYGRHSLGIYMGNPNVHSYGALMAAGIALTALGTRSRFSATSMDQLPHMLAAQQMLGHQFLLPIPDVDRTQFMLILGGNPVVSNGSIMTAPDMAGRLKALRARGGRLVVVDPRRSETAALADTHLPVIPGTDAYVLLAMLHTLFAEGRVHGAALMPQYQGVEALHRAVADFSPEQVSARCGIAANSLRQLARDFASAPSAVCYGRVGACTQVFGGTVAWLMVALNAVTGNLDRVGGAMFPEPAVDLRKVSGPGHFNRYQSRVRGLPEFAGELPVVTLAEEMDTPGEGQLRALLTVAGNPVLSAPNGRRLEKALAQLECMVSIDLYKNETTRHAHYLLPTAFGMERDHYDMAFYTLSVRNVARYVQALVPAPPHVRSDWDALLGLTEQVLKHGGGRRKQRWPLAITRRVGAKRALDLLLRCGPYGLGRGNLSLRALLRRPHGVDLGPLRPALGRLMRGRPVILTPALFMDDLPRLQAERSTAAPPLQLIGRRQLRSNNSWMHNSQRLVKGPPRCTLMMHPQDAAAHGLENGRLVAVRSRVGEVQVPLQISEEMRPGVVSLPHGWGHDRGSTSLQVAQAVPGASINDITDERLHDPVSGNAAFSGVPVQVRGI